MLTCVGEYDTYPGNVSDTTSQGIDLSKGGVVGDGLVRPKARDDFMLDGRIWCDEIW
jgi:hypothetical protein